MITKILIFSLCIFTATVHAQGGLLGCPKCAAQTTSYDDCTKCCTTKNSCERCATECKKKFPQ